VISKIEHRLVDNWRDWWRWGSMRLHVIGTAGFAYIIENPNALNNLVYGISPEWRRPFLFTLAGLWFALGWGVRMWKGKKNG
jgi:hypothetical protein